MKQFIIGENDSGQRLDKFLSKAIPTVPKGIIYKAIRTKNIKINRKRAEISTKLLIGDIVDIYIKDDFFDSSLKSNEPDFISAKEMPPIVYEDANILLVNKPVGLVVHEDESGSRDTLINRILKYLYEKGEYNPESENSFAPALCNRIDRNTSGIVIAAKNAATLRVLNEKIKLRELIKKYRCLVFGVPAPAHAVCTAYLIKDSGENRVKIFKNKVPGALTVITEYTVIKTKNNLSELDIVLHTGRTHQIRAHLAYLGHPLVGDTKYGTAAMNRNLPYRFQALCAYSLEFDFKTSGEHLEYLNHKKFTVNKLPFSLDDIQ